MSTTIYGQTQGWIMDLEQLSHRERLKGSLGKNLLAKMKFSGEESYIYDRWDGTRVPEVFNSTKLRIFGDGIPYISTEN